MSLTRPISLSCSPAPSGTDAPPHDDQSPLVKVGDDLGPRPCRFPPKEPATAGNGGDSRHHEARSEALEASKDGILSRSREESSASGVAGEPGYPPTRRTLSHAPSASSRERTASRADLHVQADSEVPHSVPGVLSQGSSKRATPAGEALPGDNNKVVDVSVVDTPAHMAPNLTTDQLTCQARDPDLSTAEKTSSAPPGIATESTVRSGAEAAETGQKRSLDELGIERDDPRGKRRKESNAGEAHKHGNGAFDSMPVTGGSAPLGHVPYPAKAGEVYEPSRSGTERSADVEVVRTPQMGESSSSTPGLARSPGIGGIPGLLMANVWRRYDQFQESNGEVVYACGALIPENYRKHPEPQWYDSERPWFPWVCPVRTCQLVYSGLKEMGKHFIVHQHCLLRDECDGTFSVAGHHPKLSPDNVSLVVSSARVRSPRRESEVVSPSPVVENVQGRAGAVDDQPRPRHVPSNAPALQKLDQIVQARQPSGRGVSRSSDKENQKAIWRYLFPFVYKHSIRVGSLEAQGLEVIAAIAGCKETKWLLDVPWQREIHLMEDGDFCYRTPSDSKALLVQMTGVEPPVPCSCCSRGYGPFVDCIVLPPPSKAAPEYSAPARLGRRLACANCRYRGVRCSKQAAANLTHLQREGASSLPSASLTPAYYTNHTLPPRRGPGRPRKYPLQTNAESNALGRQRDHVQSEQPAHQHPSRSNLTPYVLPSHQPAHPSMTIPTHDAARQVVLGRTASRPAEVLATGATAQTVHMDTPKRRDMNIPVPGSVEDEQRRPASVCRPSMKRRSTRNQPQGKDSPGESFQSEAALGRIVQQKAIERTNSQDEAAQDEVTRVEAWEKAPGRIRSTASERIDNIAFSKAYLGGGVGDEGVRVCEQASFSVQSVAPGTMLKLRASAGGVRLCAVARGKLHVQPTGEPIFVLGAHGLFKVKPGVACTVANEMSVEAVLHVTTILLDA